MDSIELQWTGHESAPRTKAGIVAMSDFAEWASATYRQYNLDVDTADLALVELIYSGAIRQLEVLDRIDLEKYPAAGMDLRHAPKPS
jgi:hypothetical protein